jgi:hypothetical protein
MGANTSHAKTMENLKRSAQLVKAAVQVELATRYDESHMPGSLADPKLVADAREQLQRVSGLELLEALLEARKTGARLGI